MLCHRVIVVGFWLVLVAVQLIFPGFEMRGLAMGLYIGCWPIYIINFHMINPIVGFLIIFILSGVTVVVCAWVMDNANIPKHVWILLVLGIIGGAIYFNTAGYGFEDWKRSPTISAAMESPEVSYEPTRWDFHKSIKIPRTIAGGLRGFYLVLGACLIWSIATLVGRRQSMRAEKPNKDASEQIE